MSQPSISNSAITVFHSQTFFLINFLSSLLNLFHVQFHRLHLHLVFSNLLSVEYYEIPVKCHSASIIFINFLFTSYQIRFCHLLAHRNSNLNPKLQSFKDAFMPCLLPLKFSHCSFSITDTDYLAIN